MHVCPADEPRGDGTALHGALLRTRLHCVGGDWRVRLDAEYLRSLLGAVLQPHARERAPEVLLEVLRHPVASRSSREEREEILRRFNALPENVRNAFRVRIDGMTEDVSNMAKALDEIGRTGVGLMAELPFGEIDVTGFEDVEIDLFGWRCKPPSNANSSGLMDHDTTALKRFVAAAAAQGADTYLQDVRDLYVLKSARDAGIRYFSGQAVITDRHIPAPNQALSMMDIYRTHKAA